MKFYVELFFCRNTASYSYLMFEFKNSLRLHLTDQIASIITHRSSYMNIPEHFRFMPYNAVECWWTDRVSHNPPASRTNMRRDFYLKSFSPLKCHIQWYKPQQIYEDFLMLSDLDSALVDLMWRLKYTFGNCIISEFHFILYENAGCLRNVFLYQVGKFLIHKNFIRKWNCRARIFWKIFYLANFNITRVIVLPSGFCSDL